MSTDSSLVLPDGLPVDKSHPDTPFFNEYAAVDAARVMSRVTGMRLRRSVWDRLRDWWKDVTW